MPLPPLSDNAQTDTYRLIPSRFAGQEDSVLAALAEDDGHLADLFALDNATNQRLLGEQGKLPGIGIQELVFAIPQYRIINAAFTYPRPQGSRFNNGERGAWYCAFEVETALAEVVFHKSVEYAEIQCFDDSVSYQAFLADFNAPFHDLRHASKYKPCLAPNSYVASQTLAAQLLAQGSLGVVYPSVRLKGGTNLACFRPALVGHVRPGPSFCMTWTGSPTPKVEKVEQAAGKAARKGKGVSRLQR